MANPRRRILKAGMARSLRSRMREKLSTADHDRLGAILDLVAQSADHRVKMSDCLHALYGKSKPSDPQADFRAFRNRVARAAKLSGIDLALEVDSRKRDAPEQRLCWFAGQDPAESELERFADQTTDDVVETLVPPLGVMMTADELQRAADERDAVAAAVAAGRMETRAMVFIDIVESTPLVQELGEKDWYETNQRFLARLKDQAKQSGGQFSNFTGDGGLFLFPNAHQAVRFGWHVLQQSGHPAIRNRVGVHVGQLVIGKTGDAYGHHVHFAARVMSASKESGLMLSTRAKEDLDLRGDPALARWFWKRCSNVSLKGFLGKHTLYEWTDREEEASPAQTPSACFPPLIKVLAGKDGDPEYEPECEVKFRGAELSLQDRLDDREDLAKLEDRAQDALAYLEKWALDPQGPVFCAVLGEFGVGKTTALKALTRRLLKRRQQGEDVPLPIFIDLKFHSESVLRGEAPVLKTLLAEILERAWSADVDRDAIGPDEILRMVREEGAILIFDGLDEKLVHLNEARGQEFIRQLWSALPPHRHRGDRRKTDGESPSIPGKLMFSCRSHYFKTIRDQSAAFRGNDRANVEAADYRACVLLPFIEEQIRDYLGRVLGPAKVDEAMTLFATVHNLKELSSRPFLLNLIVSQIRELEELKARGKPVYGVTIYELLMDRCLTRDDPKHKIARDDKPRLMEDLAAAMWRAGAREWRWEQVRTWFGQRMAEDPFFRHRYSAQDRDTLEEDLRTATFVLRPDTSADRFRFAHASLHEYFLARYLFRALRDQRRDDCELSNPSPEALEFLGQLLAIADEDEQTPALRTLETLFDPKRPAARAWALQYWLLAIKHDLPQPAPTPQQLDFSEGDFSDWSIQGRSASDPLRLAGSRWTGSNLTRAKFQNVDLRGADFRRTLANHMELQDVNAANLDLAEADLTATVWRDCLAQPLRGADRAKWYEARWIRGQVALNDLPQGFQRAGVRCPFPADQAKSLIPSTAVGFNLGHSGGVNSVSWSVDGERLASASSDNTVKVWDAATGACLSTGEKAPDWFSSRYKPLSPDRTRIAERTPDGRITIRDARTNEEMITLMAFPDGERAAVNMERNQIVSATPGAWRWIGWRWFDPDAGRLRLLPAEAFGDLPTYST